MEQSTAQRRLVKSPPELWAEVSSEDALARRLAPFGEIRITRAVPETTVAWEGERASGTVELAPAGWGTKVTLTATPAQELEAASAATDDARQAGPVAPAAPPEPAPEHEPDPDPDPDSTPTADTAPEAPSPHEPATPAAPAAPRRGLLARLFGRRAAAPAGEPAAAAPPATTPEPPPAAVAPPPPPPAPAPEPEPAPPAPVVEQPARPRLDGERTTAILSEVLDDLGAAHHRPFSRD